VRKLAPSRKPTALDPATLPTRKSRRGSRGASTLASTTRNRANKAAPTASKATVWVAVQPTWGAWEMA
jgi:hypothetical protein